MTLCAETRLLKLCTLLLSLLLSIRSCGSQSEGSWYRGCFMQTGDLFQNHEVIQANLSICSRECMNNRSYFIALRGANCRCLSRADNLQPAAENKCDNRCAELEEPNLPCGGKTFNTWSVYAASGPFIVKVEPQEIFQWIEPNIPITLEAIAVLKEFVDITEEPLIESEWRNTLEFVWQSEFKVVSVNISANSSQEQAMCTLTFPNAGHFPIDLKVRNLVSSVQTRFTVTVVIPKPRDIQLLPSIDRLLLPSCTPPTKLLTNTRTSIQNPDDLTSLNLERAEADSGVKPLVAVFVNTRFALEVSVATGSDLMFNINIWNGHFWEIFQPVPQQGGTSCNTPLTCRSVVQSYMYKTTGVFPVSATVSNVFGSVEGNLTVVVMDQRITDVTAMLVTPNSSIVGTSTKLTFHLTAVTADRQNTFIRVDFGDRVVKTAGLREKQNISLSDSYTPTLFASYGEGCNLSLQFDHMYEKEGVFVPHITLYNNVSFVTFDLKEHITVLNEILSVEIKCDKFAPVNQPFDVFVEYSSISVNVTVIWIVRDDFNNVYINRSTTSLQSVFHFAHVGRYKIECVVSNLLSNHTASAHVVVQEPIGKVNLSCTGGPYIEIKQEIVCSAKAESGSNASFNWDFQDIKPIDVRSGNLTSFAKHTFCDPGIYNISINVHNNISNVVEQLSYSIYVEIPVECLNVITTVPSLLGEAVSIVAIATRGTSLTFFLDVGRDVKISPHEVNVNGNSTIFSVSHVFPGPATHQVTVLAFNHISNASRSVDVYVQEPPPEFLIQVLPAPLPNFKTVALKSIQGEFLRRDDLLFHFHFCDGTTRVTQAPVVIWEVKHVPRRSSHGDVTDDCGYHDNDAHSDDLSDDWHDSHFHVNVTISNKVGRKSQVLSLANNESSVEDDGSRINKKRRRRRKPVLWHSTFVRTGEFTSFLLANKSRDISSLHIDYGDGTNENVSGLSDSYSWGRKFYDPGVFALDVSLHGRRSSRQHQILGSVLVVEEAVKGLRLLGPTDVGIGCDQEWTAELDAGSHIVYVWSLDGVAGKPTTVSKYVVGFSKLGSHILQLNVSNDISTAQASLSFTVKHPITDVSVDIVPNISGTSTVITVEIEGGREFTIGCSFGDGQYMTFSSSNLTLVKLRDSPAQKGPLENPVPTYQIVLKHDYKTTGEYNVSVTVSNGISSFHRITRAVVEEAIGDIVLSTENSQVLSINDPLVVTAVVTSGQNLKFIWNFSDLLPHVRSEGNTSTANHTFSMPRQYAISVTVSNHLQKGKQAALPFLVNVVEPISGLTLSHTVNAANRLQNAAALLHHRDGSNSTREMQFDARARGSSIQFMFNFGDGHFEVVNGTENVYTQMMSASAKHAYTQVGVYSVSVTALNPLGNQTVFLQEDFYVQSPPEGLVVMASHKCIQFGKKAYFNARVQLGTNVSFTWKLDDETELVNAGNDISHQYRQCGVQYIQVTASNKVDVIQFNLDVKIVEKLLGVNMTVSKSVLSVGESVHHVAIVHPPSAQLDMKYSWVFRYRKHNSSYESSNKSIIHEYMYSGRPLVQVEANNCLSSVKSAAVELHVIAKVKNLLIKILGAAIVSSPVHFKAAHWQGDSLSYTWNFGDGTENITTESSQVFHKYSQIGEYIVRLHAENAFSQEGISMRIFVLNKPCNSPDIKAVGMMASVNQSELIFLHSEPVRVEAEVEINCSTSSHVKFKWNVLDVNRQPIQHLLNWAMKNRQNYFRRPALLLPARTLERGQYVVQLIVQMNETEIPVYSELEVIVSVLATPLMSIIHGGISKYVGQENLVNLDGRGSGYPDNSSATLRYNWTCYPLTARAHDCFESRDKVPAMNQAQLSFSARLFTSNCTQFKFNLTVIRVDDTGRDLENVTSNQVIERTTMHRTIDLLLECSQCWQNTVNPDRKVSIRVHCPECSRTPLIYNWKVEVLTAETKDQESTSKAHSVCNITAASEINHLKMENSLSATTVTSKTTSSVTTVVVDGVQVPRSQTQPEMITDSGAVERQESRANERRDIVSVAEDKVGSLPQHMLPDPSEHKSHGSRRSRLPSKTGEANSLDGGFGDPKEGQGGKRGISTGVTNSSTDNVCDNICIQRTTIAPPSPTHLINEMRDPFNLIRDDQTLTGLDQASLVIKPGVLRPGRTYFVQVNARAADGTSGSATFHFKVNSSPSRGTCTLQPQAGVAMKTVFKVFCREWKDDHLPLRYEVSYSLGESDSGGDQQVVYYGMIHEVSFQLPAGLATNNYQVLVQVAIINRLGAKTLTCITPVEVRPLTLDNGENGEASTTEFLLQESNRLYQLAHDLVYEEFSGDFYGPLTLVAFSLNAAFNHLGHLETPATSVSALAREQIMDTLVYLPLRDEVEVIQALQCLVKTTSQPDELTGVTILKSRDLLKVISDKVKSLFVARTESGWSRDLYSRHLYLAVRAASNLLLALKNNGDLFISTGQQWRMYESITSDVLQVINCLVQLELQFHSLGEQPLIIQDKFISLNASHYSLYHLSPLAMNGVQFQLPASLGKLLTKHQAEKAVASSDNVTNDQPFSDYEYLHLCFQARALSFPSNPFAFLTRETDLVHHLFQPDPSPKSISRLIVSQLLVQSELASLDIYNCFGDEEFKIQNLPDEDMIEMVIPRQVHQTTNTTFGKYYLDKTVMNIHHMNTSVHDYENTNDFMEPLDKYLHIHIQLEPIFGGRTFPIMVLISSSDNPSNLSQCIFKQVYDTEDIKILLSPGSIESGKKQYYIGIVDAAFNIGRRRSTEVEGRHYTLDVWWGACVYWNHSDSRWSSDGCKVLQIENVDVLHCRCNHLTTFRGYFELIPTEMSSLNVSAFFSLHENPVAIVLVGIALVLYIVLAVLLRQADNHDSKKGNCVYLQDNSLTHRQKYEVFMETGCSRDAGTTSKCEDDDDDMYTYFLDDPFVRTTLRGISVGRIGTKRKEYVSMHYVSCECEDDDDDMYTYFLDDPFVRTTLRGISVGRIGTKRKEYVSMHYVSCEISIILHGEEGVSETRELISDDNYPMFERKSRDRFIVTLPDSLGKIFKIQLWHNNSGSSPGWFLRQVVVRDLNTGQAFYFLCQKWFAVDKDDGKVEREFTAIDGRNISFGMIFWCKGAQYLTDFHTWLSVWTCPPHSRFTRVQRLTVCFTLLMAYMCLSAMWFKRTHSEIRGEFGLLDLSWHNVIVGWICCALVLPLNLILSFMFRRSLVRYPGYEQDKMLLSGKSGCEFASECDDEPVQSTVTYSILDQSILNWQNIQDWAQKQWLKRQQSVRSSANSVKTTQASPQLSAPSTTPLVQQTLLAEDDTDQASSGFEDATSQVTTERQRIKTASDISSNWKKSKNESSDVLSASRRIFLPFWFRYVAWTLCVLISGACGAVTILYGFRFGHTLSVMWIQSIYFSFMTCLFIAQPFLILICVAYTAACHRSNPAVFDHYDDGFYGEKMTLAGLQKQRNHYHEEEEELQRGVAERSRSRYLRFAGPPQEKQLKSSRKKIIKQKRAILFLSDSVWFIVMFTLLCIIAFGKDLQMPYRLNTALKHAFSEKRLNCSSFSQLKSSSEWYRWSQSVLLDTLFKQTSLRGHHMGENLGYVIGYVQLRQLRVAPEPCYNIGISEVDQICLYTYSTDRQDSFDPGKSWLTYKEGDQTINPGLWGQSAWYGSSGYVLQLNNSRKIAAEQLAMLEAEKWIDIQTRAVFVELTLFNAASNLFSSVTLLLEVTPTGQVFTSSHILSTYMFRYISVWDNCILGCELLYIVLTVLMFYQLLHKLINLGRAYFSHFWNFIELTITILSLLYMEFYIYRFVLVSEAVEFIRSTFYEEFINLAFLTFWDELLRALVGAILFCVVVKLLRVLRYYQVFWRLQIVFRRCQLELLMAASLYGGFIMGFSSLTTVLFGSVTYSLRSLWSSILTMSALSARAFHWQNDRNIISNQSPWLDVVLLFAFTFCHGFVLTYIFSTLANRLKKTRNCKVLSLTCSQLVTLYWDKVLKWGGWRTEITYEQTDNTLPLEFTMAEILYLVEEMLFRMNALLGMSGLPDKRHSFTDSDATANGGDDGISSGGSEDPSVPVSSAVAIEGTRLEHCVQKIEDKLCSNEPYLAQLLKLDSIGTNILSQEKEQELRSHLEFEIFRQLQMQRQESAVFDAADHTNMACPCVEPIVNSHFAANKTTGAGSPGLTNLPNEMTLTLDGANGRIPMHPSSKFKNDNPSSLRVNPESSSSSQETPQDTKITQENAAVPLKPILLLPPKRSQSMKIPGRQAGGHQLTESLRNQKQWLDLSTSEATREAKLSSKFIHSVPSASKYPKISGKKDFQPMAVGCEKKTKSDITFKQDILVSKRFNKDLCPEAFVKVREPKGCRQDQGLGFNLTAATLNASLGNISPQSSESEKGHKRTDSSSGQSGHERNETRASFKRPELPPKPTFSHVILPPLEPSRALAGWSPKPRQFTFLPEFINTVGAESSSGSEQEATLSSKRVVQGRRNLRKTKSRGKGKGNEGSITSPMVLAADFASSRQSGGSEFGIIIHPVPTGINPDDHTMPEEYLS